jgi:hypothetical protein
MKRYEPIFDDIMVGSSVTPVVWPLDYSGRHPALAGSGADTLADSHGGSN